MQARPNIFKLKLVVAFIAGAVSLQARAKVDGFQDSPKGVTLGTGTYYFWLPNDNKFDPIPSLAPAGSTVADSENQFFLPSRIGFFIQRGKLNFEGFFRYMLNLRRNYTVTGGNTGSGYMTFGSYGYGLNFGIALMQSQRFQLNFVGNGEMVFQKATATYSPSTGGTDTIKLKSTSQLIGVGLQPEIWLGDMWSLSLFGGYQYGFLRYWDIASAASFMGDAKAIGPLVDANGSRTKAQFGGFLFEATLKLSFQSP